MITVISHSLKKCTEKLYPVHEDAGLRQDAALVLREVFEPFFEPGPARPKSSIPDSEYFARMSMKRQHARAIDDHGECVAQEETSNKRRCLDARAPSASAATLSVSRPPAKNFKRPTSAGASTPGLPQQQSKSFLARKFPFFKST